MLYNDGIYILYNYMHDHGEYNELLSFEKSHQIMKTRDRLDLSK